MDEMENAPRDHVREQAFDAARDLAGDAAKTVGEIRGMGLMSFFNFNRMFFPIIARYVFIIVSVLVVLGAAAGIVIGFVSIFTTGVGAGLAGIVCSALLGLLGLVLVRFYFELMLVGFGIHDNTRKLVDLLRNK